MTVPLEVDADRLSRRDSARIIRIVRAAVPAVAPTVALAVWRGGHPVLELRAGWMDPETRSRPTAADARFDLASVTKTITAGLVLRSVSDGRVALDDPLAGVVPEVGLGDPRPVDGGQEPLTRRRLAAPPERRAWRVDPGTVTIRQLLAHSSGMAPWRAVFEACGPVPRPPDEADDVPPGVRWAAGLRAVLGYPFVDRPGRAVHYSDLGYLVLGEVACRLGGASLDGLVRDRLARPLGIGSLGYRPLDAGAARDLLVPTSIDGLWRHRRCWGEPEDENAAGLGAVAGHAGLFATAADLARLGQAWLDRDERLGIRPDLLAEATRPQTPGLGAARGLGWQVRDGEPPTEEDAWLAPFEPGAFGHTGFTGTSLAVDPARAMVIVLLTNRVHAGRTHPGIDPLRVSLHRTLVEVAGG